MRGCKPKPAAVHAQNGNPSHLNLDARRAMEPKAAEGAPPRPAFLNPTAAEAWDYLTAHLAKMGTLAQSDQQALAMLCQAYGLYAEAMAEVNSSGAVVSVAGQAQPSPFLSVANKQAAIITKLLTEFGLTPSGRARISLKPAPGRSEKPGAGILKFLEAPAE